jgi:hypothetical protein
VHPHWLYKREDTIREYRNEVEDVLEPSVVTGKGRPKKQKRAPDTFTRRDKSHWEMADWGFSLEVMVGRAAEGDGSRARPLEVQCINVMQVADGHPVVL